MKIKRKQAMHIYRILEDYLQNYV